MSFSATTSGGRVARAGRVTATLIFAFALLWPIVWVAWNGWTLTGLYEESVGYRYFYSLRALYEPSASLFMPHGQTVELVQKLVQLGLTAAGYPPTQVEPRIDYFVYASVFIFQLLNIAAFAWMVAAIRSFSGAILSATFWALPFYTAGLSAPYTLLHPDYHALEAGFALLTAGTMIRTAQRPGLEIGRAIWMGVFAGFAISTKVTLAIFPMACLGHMLLTGAISDLRQTARFVMVGLALCMSIFLAAVLIETGLDWSEAARHFIGLYHFIRGNSGGGFVVSDQSW